MGCGVGRIGVRREGLCVLECRDGALKLGLEGEVVGVMALSGRLRESEWSLSYSLRAKTSWKK